MVLHLIRELMEYGMESGLVPEADRVWTANRLLALFGEEGDVFAEAGDKASGQPGDAPAGEKASGQPGAGPAGTPAASRPRPLADLLADLTAEAARRGLIGEDTQAARDLFDTKVMGLLTPAPSAVQAEFVRRAAADPEDATNWFYALNQASNYIRMDRIAKDVKWSVDSAYGKIDITINCSKPEKDPRDIALAGQRKASGYPKCLLCRENEGFAGNIGHPARQNLRLVPVKLAGEPYFFQYSPYVYYNEHCIILSEEHRPMKIDRAVFAKLLDFVGQFPHYTAGSNADLPIVGGSILSHDHFQGGRYEFPMVRAPYETMFRMERWPGVTAGTIRWPLSAIRLTSEDPAAMAEAADHILTVWRGYTDEAAMIFSETEGTPHNTITPIARVRGGKFELDLVLRNNITTPEHPLGLFHPHEEYWHVKKENIGLIEVMGLAILPPRLLASLDTLGQEEIGRVFVKVLECAGVFKRTPEGQAAFGRFLEAL